MKDVILFGPPGCGKGTQAELLLQKFPDIFIHMSTGDVFRALLSKPNALGAYITNILDTGTLISDNVTNSLFTAYFFTVLETKKYMLLDGYPRTIEQVRALEKIVKQYDREIIGFYFIVPKKELVRRMLQRSRPKETEEIIHNRIKEYTQHTQLAIKVFSSKYTLIKIDAYKPIDSIHAEICYYLS